MKKDKFVIISKGEELEIKSYLSSMDISSDFKQFVEREALGLDVQRGMEAEESSPQYLKIANKLGFSWEKNSILGFINYDWKAELMMELVKRYAYQLVQNLDMPIYKVRGSNSFDIKHEVVQKYMGLFGDRMLKVKQSKSELVMGYDASYAQFNLAASKRINESKLPYGHFSISDC